MRSRSLASSLAHSTHVSMARAWLLLLLLLLGASVTGERSLSRKKRYLVFPEGAGLSVVYCLTWGTSLATDIFTFGQTLGIGFELPTNSSVFLSKYSSNFLHRIERRSVYSKLQVLLDSRGMDGRACILRAICEAAGRSQPGSFLDTILRTIFTFPLSEGEYVASEDQHRDFDDAQWKGWTNADCGQLYPDCSASLLKLAFEKLGDPFAK